MTSLTLLINHSTQDAIVGASGTDWIAVDPNYDILIFSQGSLSGGGVSDGDAIPTEALLNRYAVQLDAINPVIVPKYFLADYSVNLLREIKLAGNQNNQFVFAAQFNGATATEPVLEAWDTSNMDTFISPALGGGTSSASWYKAISTNLTLPGANWIGTSLAGAGTSNILLLNNNLGVLTGAASLYFNFKIVIPGGYITPIVATPVLSIIYTTN